MMMADSRNKSFYKTAAKMWRDGGLTGMFRGNLTTVLKILPQTATQFAVRFQVPSIALTEYLQPFRSYFQSIKLHLNKPHGPSTPWPAGLFENARDSTRYFKTYSSTVATREKLLREVCLLKFPLPAH